MTVKINSDDYYFRKLLQDIVDRNVKTIPYEGDEINKSGIVDDIMDLFKSKEYSLLKHSKSEKL